MDIAEKLGVVIMHLVNEDFTLIVLYDTQGNLTPEIMEVKDSLVRFRVVEKRYNKYRHIYTFSCEYYYSRGTVRFELRFLEDQNKWLLFRENPKKPFNLGVR